MGRRVLITGLDTFWGGRMAQALEADPDVEMILGLGTDEPRVAARAHRVRPRPTRSTRSSAASCGPPRWTPSSTPSSRPTRSASRSPGPPRDQRDRHAEPAGGRRRAGLVGAPGGGQVLDPRLRLGRAGPGLVPRGDTRDRARSGPGSSARSRGRGAGPGLRRRQPRTSIVTVLRFANVLGTDIVTPISHNLRRRLLPVHRRLRSAGPVRRGGRRRPGPRVRHRPPDPRASSTWPATGKLPWSEVASIGGAHLPAAPAGAAPPVRRPAAPARGRPVPPEMEASSATAGAWTPRRLMRGGLRLPLHQRRGGRELRPGQQPAPGDRLRRARLPLRAGRRAVLPALAGGGPRASTR